MLHGVHGGRHRTFVDGVAESGCSGGAAAGAGPVPLVVASECVILDVDLAHLLAAAVADEDEADRPGSHATSMPTPEWKPL